MQTFIVANEIGTKIDLAGINEKTIKAAKRFFRAGTDDIRLAADIARPGNAFWFHVADQDRALELLGNEKLGPVVSARSLKDNEKAQKAASQAASNAYFVAKSDGRRVRHVKFGEGTVLSEDEKAVSVLFDKQKKPVRMVASVLEAI